MMKHILLLMFVSVTLTSNSAHAGFFESLKTVVGGHAKDLKSRFEDDQIIDGDIVARAEFRDDDRGQDMLHRGSGSVYLVDTPEGRYIQLAENFSSTPGPDYHVYISQDKEIDHEDRFVKDNQTELGRLIKGSGATYYKIPEDTDFQSVTIWCKAFNEFITSADFKS